VRRYWFCFNELKAAGQEERKALLHLRADSIAQIKAQFQREESWKIRVLVGGLISL
jgi:hypothetical protein